MLLRLIFIPSLAYFGEAFHGQYPATSPCIMMNAVSDNTITWTDSTGNTISEPFSFEGSAVYNGACVSFPSMSLRWAVDGAVLTISLSLDDTTGNVKMDMVFAVIPKNVFFGSTIATQVQMKGQQIPVGVVAKSFKCISLQEIKFSTYNDPGNTEKLDLIMKLSNLQIQGFDIPSNGAYSPAVECDADIATTKPTTRPTTIPTSKHATKPTSKPKTQAPFVPGNHPDLELKVIDSDINCIMVKGQISFTLPYPKADKTMGSMKVGVQDVKEVTGDCNKTDSNTLIVYFYEDWNMTVQIMKGASSSAMLAADDSKDYSWRSIELNYSIDKKVFPDAANTTEMMCVYAVSNVGYFNAPMEGSYICNAETTTTNGNITIETWNLQYNAFQTSVTQTGFPTDNIQECSADSKTNIILPIAAASFLAGLIVIVLIAYLVDRRNYKALKRKEDLQERLEYQRKQVSKMRYVPYE